MKDQVIFHGGCLGCTMQTKNGLGYCVGCMYFEANWKLPDLNNEHIARKKEVDHFRDVARKMAEKK